MANKNMKIKPSVLSDLLDAIPTTWLDSLLTGENAVIGQPPYNTIGIGGIVVLCMSYLVRGNKSGYGKFTK